MASDDGTSLSPVPRMEGPDFSGNSETPRASEGEEYILQPITLSMKPANEVEDQSWKMSYMPPDIDEVSKYRLENNQLRLQLKQLQVEVQSEQEAVAQVRRRLNAVEKERLESASKSNSEISDLESHVAKLRSQLEKGEADKQNLDFELTKARRDVSHQNQLLAEKESVYKETKTQLEKKVHEMAEVVRQTETQLDRAQQSTEDTERKLHRQLDEKDHELAKSHTEQEILRAERDKLDAVVLQHESALTDFNEKIQELDNDRKNHTENLRRALTEIEYAKEREERLKKDLEMSLHRLRTIEESIEAERAAHLETKFNSEIVQLRVRDLEGAMDVEKSANNEANKAIDRLTKQIRELEHSYEEERKNGKDLANKLEKVEKEYSAVKKQLTSEVENKKTIIGNLSKELEIHQKNFNELKEELTKAKKRQIYLEETYGGSMRELELLLDNFQVDDKSKKTKSKRESSKPPVPSAVLENLRLTLSEYKKRLDYTKEELGRMKKQSDVLHREVDQCKEMIWTKDKSLEDAQKNYTRTAKELNRIRSEYGDLETSMARMKLNLESTSTNQTKERKRVHELSEEIMKLVKRHKAEDEEKMAFLHGMYQRLLAGRVMVPTKDTGFSQFSWADLTSLVYEQVSSMVNVLQRSEEKNRHLEEALKGKDEAAEEFQKSHEEQISKLTSLTKDRESSWQKQKEEIENHYVQLLNELQSRSKKSQAMADQAWEKIRMTGSVKQGLESECSDLRVQVTEVQKQNTALLAACSLLSGALFPMCARANHLAVQRRQMEDQVNMWDVCRERVELLVDTLGAEMKVGKGETPTPPKKRHPLLVFRAGVITVIAANRLRHLGRVCTKMFVTYDSAVCYNSGITVCTGGARPAIKSFMGARDDDREETQTDILRWISNSELLNTVMSSTSDLLEVVSHIREKDKASPVETRALTNAARNTFTKLIDKLSRHFEGVDMHPNSALRERNSLVKRMGKGLVKVCSGKPLEQRQHLAPLQDILGALQNHILDFAQRLHSVEIERRNLLLELDKLKEDMGDKGIEDGKDPKFVAMDKFESVCFELNNALKREQQAQQLLIEQGKQLEEMSLRLDLYTTEGMEKEHHLTETVHGLSEAKAEVKKKEQILRQLNRQVITMESEKKSLLINVSDAEKALRTAARDKEILASYIKAVETALDQARRDISLAKGFGARDGNLSKMLLSADFIPTDIGKAGPELIACQNLVGAFVEAQQQAYAKIRALEEDVDSHKQHITSLKRELSDAVRREYDECEVPTRDGSRLLPNESISDTTQGEFRPIKEDSEISFSVPKPATPKTRLKSSKAEKSPKYQTPVRSSSRPQHIRPKAFEPHGR